MFSGRKSARSDAGARFAASVSVTTGVEVFSGKTGKPRVSNLRPCWRFCQRKHQSKSEDGPEKPENSERRKRKRPTPNANVEGRQSAAGGSHWRLPCATR